MNLSRVGLIVSVRCGSRRLPFKALLPLLGKPMIVVLLERLYAGCCLSNNLVVATTTLQTDDELARILEDNQFTVFRGHASDLVRRHLDLADVFGFNYIVRVTADCPMVNADLVNYCLQEAARSSWNFDLASTKGSFPIGLDAEVFSVESLRRADLADLLSYDDREHLTKIFYNGNFRVRKILPINDFRKKDDSFTVDTLDDYLKVAKIFREADNIFFNPMDTNGI